MANTQPIPEKSIKIPKPTHRMVKVKAATLGRDISDVADEAIKHGLPSVGKPIPKK